ncbi:MAG: hypothetical protein K6G38_01335 [Gammaproteobacteria bacterium]|nr:hypothetical protein [Gammaproteobacteria bacterium]
MDQIKEFIVNYLGIIADAFKNLVDGDMWWLAAIIVVVAAILIIIGFIRLLVKSWKVVLVLAIIGGIGFAVYWFVLKDKMGASALLASLNILKSII